MSVGPANHLHPAVEFNAKTRSCICASLVAVLVLLESELAGEGMVSLPLDGDAGCAGAGGVGPAQSPPSRGRLEGGPLTASGQDASSLELSSSSRSGSSGGGSELARFRLRLCLRLACGVATPRSQDSMSCPLALAGLLNMSFDNDGAEGRDALG